jgi:hypothetical protein
LAETGELVAAGAGDDAAGHGIGSSDVLLGGMVHASLPDKMTDDLSASLLTRDKDR